MVGEQLTVAEMVDEILVCFSTLDPRRKYMFVEWLQAHSGQAKNTNSVCEGLTAWLESMQHENNQREYRLVLDEIEWWRTLDDQYLAKIMLADLTSGGAK